MIDNALTWTSQMATNKATPSSIKELDIAIILERCSLVRLGSSKLEQRKGLLMKRLSRSSSFSTRRHSLYLDPPNHLHRSHPCRWTTDELHRIIATCVSDEAKALITKVDVRERRLEYLPPACGSEQT